MIVMKSSAVPDNGNFSRASAGTFIGYDGLLKTANSNAPRYVNGLLVMEGAATNLLFYSAQLDNAGYWTKSSSTFVANIVAAPDGTATADEVLTTGSSSGGVYQVVSVTAGTAMVFSFWAKRSAATAAAYRVYNITGAADIVATTSYYATINAATWTRVSVAFTVPAGCTSLRAYVSSDNSASGTGAYVWGAQLETGSVATSYIPTTTTTAGRAVDSYTAGYIVCHDIDGVSVGLSPVIIDETDDAPLWAAATTYALNALVVRTQTHRVYRRLVAGTTATVPESDKVNWVEVSATKKFLPFDGKTNNDSMLIGFYSLGISLFLGGANALSLVGMRGKTATVKITDGAGGAVLYSASKTFADDRFSYPAWSTAGSSWKIVDWHLFELPFGYPSAVAHIVISAGPTLTEYATVREILYGGGFDIGATQLGVRVSIIDYSRKETDAFGTVTLVRRPFSRRMSCDIQVPLADFQRVFSLLADLRATVCQWIPESSGSYQPLMIQGWYRDFSIAVSYPTYLLCTLEVESLAVDTLVEA